MKKKVNYSVVRMTLEIEEPNNKKKKKKVIHSKKVSTVIHTDDNEKIANAFVDFTNSIEQTRLPQTANKPKNLFKKIWRNVKGHSKSSGDTYYNVLRS